MSRPLLSLLVGPVIVAIMIAMRLATDSEGFALRDELGGLVLLAILASIPFWVLGLSRASSAAWTIALVLSAVTWIGGAAYAIAFSGGEMDIGLAAIWMLSPLWITAAAMTPVWLTKARASGTDRPAR